MTTLKSTSRGQGWKGDQPSERSLSANLRAYAQKLYQVGPQGESAHIHIQREKMLAKFWLNPVTLAGSTRFSPKELRKLESFVIENRDILLEAWNEYFSD